MNGKLNLTPGERAGRQLKKIRETDLLTQEEAAEKASTTPRTWQRWENHLDSLNLIEQLGKIFNFTLDGFIQDLSKSEEKS